MSIEGLGGVGAGQNMSAPQLDNQDGMGQEEFTDILVTQLKHQDPLDPMDDREFIVQMTQFSKLEQLQNLNEHQQQFSTMNLLGKEVVATKEDGEQIQGVVDGVRNLNETPTLEVNGEQVEHKNIQQVVQNNLEEGSG